MNSVKIGVQIKKVRNMHGSENFKANIPMSIIFEKTFSGKRLEEALENFERTYSSLIEYLKEMVMLIKKRSSKNKVILYWNFGDAIVNFEKKNNEGPLVLEKATKHFVRDVGVSDKMIIRCKRFRLLYPDITKIDKKKSFDSYVRTFERGYISKNRLGRRKYKNANI